MKGGGAGVGGGGLGACHELQLGGVLLIRELGLQHCKRV
jgi:hypothetical protein